MTKKGIDHYIYYIHTRNQDLGNKVVSTARSLFIVRELLKTLNHLIIFAVKITKIGFVIGPREFF